MFTVKSHRLCRDGAPVAFRTTPNMGGKLKPEILVMHYTGSSSTEGAIAWLTRSEAQASAHLVIAPDGTVTQLVPFDRVAWHAGRSEYQGRTGCNGFAIGIELVNAGLLIATAGGGYREQANAKKVVAASDVMPARHKNGGGVQPWAVYDPRQIEAATDVARAIVDAYRLKDIVGHDDIAPGRKVDPGPAFPLRMFRVRVLGRVSA